MQSEDILVEVEGDPGPVMIPRRAVGDRLSSTAVGVLARILADPPEPGRTTLDELTAALCARDAHRWDGPEEVRGALVELIHSGYLQRPGRSAG